MMDKHGYVVISAICHKDRKGTKEGQIVVSYMMFNPVHSPCLKKKRETKSVGEFENFCC